MNIDNMDDDQVVRAINDELIDDEYLISRSGWSRICRARGRNLRLVDEQAWQSLCARRGYVLYRKNPRGF
jgi:hypothetical protein